MSKHGLLNPALVGMFAFIPLLQGEDTLTPSQILSAKKVFVSNAGVDCLARERHEFGCPGDVYYSEFSSAMKRWGRFELAASPADADLVLELAYESLLLPNGDRDPVLDARYKLTVIDARTHFILWCFILHPDTADLAADQIKNRASVREQIKAYRANFAANRTKSHALAREQIVTDFRALVGSTQK